MIKCDLVHGVSQLLHKAVRLLLRGRVGYEALSRLFTRVVLETCVEDCAGEDSWQEEAEDGFEDEHEGLVETTEVCQVVEN